MPSGIYIRTEETKRKLSEAHKGKSSGMKGKYHSKKTIRKMSEAKKGKVFTEEHRHRLSEAAKIRIFPEETKRKLRKARIGKTHSEETKKKMSEAKKGKNHPMYGKNCSEETKLKMSEARKGKTHTKETKRKLSKANKGIKNPMYGKNHTEEARQKIRIAAMNRMINNNIFPNFNKFSIQYFDILNKVIFSNGGQYGINEYCIPKLGYWLDFISRKYKVIIEYDENKHKYQIEKDEIRQNNIQAYYPDYKFIRIKEDDAKINILASIFANMTSNY